MLQQTQVATVISYWTRWMERFSTVSDLAEAPLDDVLKHWQGLGYYARARYLHRAAQVIHLEYGGKFPERFEDVLALPGVGRYTAGAICSIALGMDVPIVDANVIRVLCRVFGLRGDPKSSAVQEQLWQLAEELIPEKRARDFNQAMMELGALVCQAKPDCPRCPVREICAAYASGDPQSLPEFAPKPEFTRQTDVSALLAYPDDAHPNRAKDSERFLVVRRPEGGLWGGLYEFPRVTAGEGETSQAAAVRALREICGLDGIAEGEPVATVRHGVMTRKITLLAVSCRLQEGSSPDPHVPEGYTFTWATPAELQRLALSSPQAKLLENVTSSGEQLRLF